MTDRLGGAGRDPRFNPLGSVQGVPAIGQAGRPLPPPPRQAGPRFATDALQLSEETRSHYAALIEGRAAVGDPELMLHMQLVHGPNSPLYQGLQASQHGRERIAGPSGLPPGPTADDPPRAGPLERLFTRAFAEVAFAWRNFAATQPW